MPHEAETRPVTVGSRMRETAFLCRLRRQNLVACPSLWVSVSHIDGTGEIMISEVRRIGGLRPPAEVTGPLAEHAAAFRRMLIEQGYARGTIRAHLGLMSQVSRWLDVQGLPARALADLAEVDRFFAERRAKGCRLRITARSLVPLLDFLRDRQVIGAPVVPAATPAEVLLAEYRTYLEQERAATAGTVVNFTKYAGTFLRTFPCLGSDSAQQADLAAALGRLTAAEVVTFVTGWASCRSPAMSVRRWPTTCAAAVSVATARTCSCGPKHRSPAWRGPGSPRWCSALAGGRACPRSGRTGSATPWPRSCDARAPR